VVVEELCGGGVCWVDELSSEVLVVFEEVSLAQPDREIKTTPITENRILGFIKFEIWNVWPSPRSTLLVS